MKHLIRKIIKEESEKNPKSKLENLINTFGIVKVINMVGLENLLDTLNLSETELFKKYNPFEKIFTDEEFDEHLNSPLEYILARRYDQGVMMFNRMVDYYIEGGTEKILDYIIELIIDSLHWKLVNFDFEDWKIPNTPELIKLIYSNRIKNNPNFIKLFNLIKSYEY